MGNKYDGKPSLPSNPTSSTVHVKQGDVEKFGNSDVKILAKAYVEFSKEGLSDKEITKLKKMDEILEGVEFSSLDSDSALLLQEGGGVFSVLSDTLANDKTQHTTSKAKKHR